MGAGGIPAFAKVQGLEIARKLKSELAKFAERNT